MATRKPLAVPPVGAVVESPWSRTGPMVVLQADPWAVSLTNVLCRKASGALCWYAAHTLRPVDGSPAPWGGIYGVVL